MTDLATSVLSYGDNLDSLRCQLPDAAVDLVYLDPPFNSGTETTWQLTAPFREFWVLSGTHVDEEVELAGNEGAISPEDREKIIVTATDYIESWIAGDADRMAGCMHPELVKRSLEPDPQTGSSIVDTLTRAGMVALTAAGEGAEDAGPYQVSVLDAYGDIATVSVLSAPYMDYLQVARFGDAWLILNVLWQPRLGR